MGDEPEKKKEYPIIVDIWKTVVSGVLMLICTTLYNLFLAHIWPVTIHFGEYSFNNYIFILVSVLTSLILMFGFFLLGLHYVLRIIADGLTWILTPADQRKPRKLAWYEHIQNAMVNAFIWAISLRQKKDEPELSENAKHMLSQLSSPHSEKKQS